MCPTTRLYVKLSSGGESGMKNTTLTWAARRNELFEEFVQLPKSEAALATGLALSCGFVPLKNTRRKNTKISNLQKRIQHWSIKRLASPCLMSGLSDLED